jgi:uncharacterized repeat protein (TIGR02543 family)
MPEADVTVTAEFEDESVQPIAYTVSIDSNITGGDITASPTMAAAGETITLSISPDTGKRLKAGSLKYTYGAEIRDISGNSFTMPEADVTVTAEFEDESVQPIAYTVSIDSNITGGAITASPTMAAAGETITLNITPDTGKRLKAGSLKYTYGTEIRYISGTSFNMPEADVTVTAEFEDEPIQPITYTVTFDKNGGDIEASPTAIEVISGGKAGSLPAAPVRSGYTFNGWNTQADGSGTAFTADTAVTGSITVYARWIRNNSNEDNGNSGGTPGNTPGNMPGSIGDATAPTEGTKSDTNVDGKTVTATTTVTAVVDGSGNAAAAVSLTQVSNAISKAVEEARKQGEGALAKIEIKLEASADVTSTEVSIPKEAMSRTSEAGICAFTITTPIASITFDTDTLSAISDEAVDELKITASKADVPSLSPEVQRQVGDRPVFDFNVTCGNRTISRFWGDVSLSIPYTPKEGEDTNAIVIYYINDSGELEIVRNCVYDPMTGRISFSTRHFSRYAIGYNKISFKDVAEGAWYGKAVSFIAAREITTGIGESKFSPEAKLTRGQFIVLLMRAYGIAPDVNPNDNFADAGETYYTGYLAAAKRLSISGGIGNNMFAPENEITRQEMFTLLYNVLKTVGRMPKGTSGKTLSSFNDYKDIASWAGEAMKHLVESGIISGNGDKLFPTSTTTRAEMAQVIYNLLSK